MARAKQKRRVPKEELAVAVRKHFKEAPVVENECMVEVMYRVRTQGISFRNHEMMRCIIGKTLVLTITQTKNSG